MDMTQLSCFIAVADTLNFAKAAKSLHLSQAAVSKRIKSLEQELNIPLFERSTRSVSLTNAGRIFYPHAKNLLVHEKNIINSLAQIEASGINPIYIGSYTMEIYTYIDQVIRNVCKKQPNIWPDVVLASVQPLNACLENHAIDLVIGIQEMLKNHGLNTDTYKELALAPLKLVYAPSQSCQGTTSKTAAECNSHSPLSSKDITPEITRQYFGLDKLIMCHELDDVYTKIPELTNILYTYSQNTIYCDNLESATSVAKAGLGFLILPLAEQMHRDRLCYEEIKDIKPFSYGYFYCKNSISDAMELFTEELEAFFQP